jgi:dinuclear metal center YbgI/SA1388 family protein
MACPVGDIIALVEELAPPAWAEDWDNVGLQVGSRLDEVKVALVSLDATPDVMAEARELGAGLLICHHPLIFRPLRRLTTDEPGGRLLRDALVSGVAVYSAHTNLDASPYGVNFALAELFGLEGHRPLGRVSSGEAVKLITFLPPRHVAAVSSALYRSGAGVIGDYSGCSFRVEGTGTFTPGPRSRPACGDVSGPNEIEEVRLEVSVAGERLRGVIEALLDSHPYEEPAYDIYPLGNPAVAAFGRVGDLPEPLSLEDLARRCRLELGNPAVRMAGDPGLVVRRVAVCGGSGADAMVSAMDEGAQVLITGDVGHHEAIEAMGAGLAVIDAGHYHTEWPVVPHLASILAERAAAAGLEVEILVSHAITCPWRDGGAE